MFEFKQDEARGAPAAALPTPASQSKALAEAVVSSFVDRLIAEAAAEMTDVDVLILEKFTMSGARDAIAEVPGRPVLTAPNEAVKKLRRLLEET